MNIKQTKNIINIINTLQHCTGREMIRQQNIQIIINFDSSVELLQQEKLL